MAFADVGLTGIEGGLLHILVYDWLDVGVEIELLFQVAVVVAQRTLEVHAPAIVFATTVVPAVVGSAETGLF